MWKEDYRTVMQSYESRDYGLAGIPSEVQRLMYSGRQLEDEQTLAHYDVERGALVTLTIVCSPPICWLLI